MKKYDDINIIKYFALFSLLKRDRERERAREREREREREEREKRESESESCLVARWKKEQKTIIAQFQPYKKQSTF